MRLILASNNEKKLREMRDILAGLGLEVVSQGEAGLQLEAEETGNTFYENARLKAQAACAALGEPAVADDSGLAVDALGGAPGVWSARYGSPELSDEDRCELLLKNMEGQENRAAKFVSSIVCLFPNGDELRAEYDCPGTILTEMRGDGGFGYDPLFFIPEFGRTMAELSPDEKNLISHRGKSLRAFEAKLREYLKNNGESIC